MGYQAVVNHRGSTLEQVNNALRSNHSPSGVGYDPATNQTRVTGATKEEVMRNVRRIQYQSHGASLNWVATDRYAASQHKSY
jgi:hypothetical protein